MNRYKSFSSLKTKSLTVFVMAVMVVTGLASFAPVSVNPVVGKSSAACLPTAPPTTYGQDKQTVTVATAGTYRVWSRIKAPNTTANSYYFQVDSGCAYNVGDSTTIPANAWTWVNYQDGTTASTIDVTLTAGSHQLTYTGKEADVQLDRVMLLTNTGCLPTGVGDNCAVNDVTPPVTSVTAPVAGATVSGAATTIAANATDASGVSKVEFLVDGAVIGTDTTSAYSAVWNTTTATNGSHTLQSRAYDTGNNIATSASVAVTVNNAPAADTTPPTVSITAPVSGASVATGATVTINATAADNVGVTKVEFYVDGTLKSTDTASPYSYVWPAAGAGAHSLTARAYDAAAHVTTSAAVSVTVTGTTATIGDVNGDGRVNALDLSVLLSHDGQNYPPADFNGDGTVGAADMAMMLAHWTW